MRCARWPAREIRRGRGGAPGWALARNILYDVFETRCPPGARIHVGRARLVGEGLPPKGYAASVALDPDREQLSGRYIVLLPDWLVDSDFNECAAREARILSELQDLELPFRTPSLLAQVEEDE